MTSGIISASGRFRGTSAGFRRPRSNPSQRITSALPAASEEEALEDRIPQFTDTFHRVTAASAQTRPSPAGHPAVTSAKVPSARSGPVSWIGQSLRFTRQGNFFPPFISLSIDPLIDPLADETDGGGPASSGDVSQPLGAVHRRLQRRLHRNRTAI